MQIHLCGPLRVFAAFRKMAAAFKPVFGELIFVGILANGSAYTTLVTLIREGSVTFVDMAA
ncbi:hypothetical protein SL1157_1951 [Ruegeria lacuscaerulensis ITI-1157]|nr:hypothetical protein SL1157_1951 [Ruegeria lacuscaerulensis ITI-1157]